MQRVIEIFREISWEISSSCIVSLRKSLSLISNSVRIVWTDDSTVRLIRVPACGQLQVYATNVVNVYEYASS